jgi:hypothetical protein
MIAVCAQAQELDFGADVSERLLQGLRHVLGDDISGFWAIQHEFKDGVLLLDHD